MKKYIITVLFCFPFSFLFGQVATVDSLSTMDSLVNYVLDADTVKTADLPERESFFDAISKDEIFEMNLEADFDSIITHRKKLDAYLAGKLSYNDGEETVKLKVRVKPRGKYRRKVCEFPPLRLKFKKKGLKKMGLNQKYNTFKLVSHCLEDDKVAKANILREYLVYKMYNLHSELSLRAQLVKVTYYQTGKSKKIFTRYGILIESEDEIANRTNTLNVDKKNCSVDSVSVFGGTVQALFQCMIGNADWSLMHMRNIKLLRQSESPLYEVFPYDFDFAGLVNPDYAIPNPDYKLRNLQQRVFLGKIHSEEELQLVAQHFLDRKKETLELCKQFKVLPKWARKDITKYLKSFYKMLEQKGTMCDKLLKISPKK